MLLNNRYQFEKKLGEGVYSTAYLATDIFTNKLVAVKRHKEQPQDRIEGYNFEQLREINVLQELAR